MSIHLPAPLAAYFQLENAGDADALMQHFSTDAEVRDEGKSHHGRAAIAAWSRASHTKYTATMTPLTCTSTPLGGKVACEVVGNFPGSPLVLQFDFQIEADAITRLEVTV